MQLEPRATGASAISVAVFALLTLAAALPTAGSAQGTACDRFAAPTGLDSNPGTLARPVRSPQALVDSLRKRQVGCLRTGTYPFSRTAVDRDVTLRPYGSEDVVLVGTIKVLPRGAGATLKGMSLVGVGGTSPHGPQVYADDVVLRNNDITNLHTGICVLVGTFHDAAPPRDVLIEDNRIHHCGTLPPTNHQHGIYVAIARGILIRGNWIYANADRGVQFYPSAERSRVAGNVIDGNGMGVLFASVRGARFPSNHNVVEGNVIANSKIRWNAASGPKGPTGPGNRVRGNCVFGGNADDYYNANGGVQSPSRNFTAQGNLVAEPSYLDPAAHDYRLQPGSACAVKLDDSQHLPQAGDDPPGP